MNKHILKDLAESMGGKIESVTALPDGSGCATMSLPLPKDHWIYEKDKDGFQPSPPMPLRMGNDDILIFDYVNKNQKFRNDEPSTLTKRELSNILKEAGKYAIRGATMGGTTMDFDPDALLQNLVVGLLGYWTDNGLFYNSWENPKL